MSRKGRSKLDVNMIVVAGSLAALEPQLWVADTQCSLQVRLDQDLPDAGILGQMLDQGLGPRRFQWTIGPKGLEQAHIPSHRQGLQRAIGGAVFKRPVAQG